MAKRAHSDWDESDVKIRPGKGSRPRTKDRPAHNNAQYGMVVTKDRGRWGVVLDDAPAGQAPTVCMRARELGRTDDDTDPYERIVVANADQLLIVSAVADPPPRSGFVERALVAAFVGGLNPVICLTKTDLASPDAFAAKFADLNVPVITCGTHDPISHVHDVVDGHITALIGHSGVGKSTLVNRLVPDADRATGEVSGVGKGRHTSTQSIALRLRAGGWIIDTPGIRSFGLAHVDADTVIAVFDDLAKAADNCPRGCTHMGPPADPECALDELAGASAHRTHAVRSLLGALRTNEEWM